MVSKGSSPTPPAPINYANLIHMMTNANEGAAQYNAVLNRVNQFGPTGSTTYARGPGGVWSQTTSLSQPQRGLLNQSQNLAQGALGALNSQSNRAFDFGVKPVNLQTSVQNPGVPVTSLQSAGDLQRGVNPGQQLQYGINGSPLQSQLDLSGVSAIPQANNAAYNKAVNSVYNQATSRLDPQWQQQQTQLQTQLTDQGIPQGSDAWNKAMMLFQQGKNDAYTSAENNAVTQGSQVENNLFNMGLQANQAGVSNALQSGNFANQAQAQGFGQGLSNADLNNAAQQQRFGENLSNAQLNNAAQQQKYQENLGSAQFANSAANQQLAQALAAAGFGNSANEQMFQNSLQNANLNNTNRFALDNLRLQETGMPAQFSQISLPGTTGAQVQPADVLGAASLNSQMQMANYQNQVAQNSSAKGGLGSLLGTLGSAAIISDRRVKRDIKRMGSLRGIPVYSYRYAWEKNREIGVMAQDIEKIIPSAVVISGGVKRVDYAKVFAH